MADIQPVLSFPRGQISSSINDENKVKPLISRRASLKRSNPATMSPFRLAKKKSHQTPVVIKKQQKPSSHQPATTSQSPQRKESESRIMRAIQLSEQDPDLIGDFSRPYALPVFSGKHSDLKTIKPETLAALLRGQFKDKIDKYTIIDGRFPYEFEGGHINGAINIYEKSTLNSEFLGKKNDLDKTHNILIFHCEFSSERGPGLARFLRNQDREMNASRYPQLYHPEIYLLDGGYKAFFEKFKELCSPKSYCPMLSGNHKPLMRQFRAKAKILNAEAIKKK